MFASVRVDSTVWVLWAGGCYSPRADRSRRTGSVAGAPRSRPVALVQRPPVTSRQVVSTTDYKLDGAGKLSRLPCRCCSHTAHAAVTMEAMRRPKCMGENQGRAQGRHRRRGRPQEGRRRRVCAASSEQAGTIWGRGGPWRAPRSTRASARCMEWQGWLCAAVSSDWGCVRKACGDGGMQHAPAWGLAAVSKAAWRRPAGCYHGGGRAADAAQRAAAAACPRQGRTRGLTKGRGAAQKGAACLAACDSDEKGVVGAPGCGRNRASGSHWGLPGAAQARTVRRLAEEVPPDGAFFRAQCQEGCEAADMCVCPLGECGSRQHACACVVAAYCWHWAKHSRL